MTARFDNFQYDQNIQFDKLNLLNQYMLVRLNTTIQQVNQGFLQYNFQDAANTFHTFWLHDFCDFYIESSKFIFQSCPQLVQETLNVLFHVLESGLRLLHPMMPFLSEELYAKLPFFTNKHASLCIADYPQFNKDWEQPQVIQTMEAV